MKKMTKIKPDDCWFFAALIVLLFCGCFALGLGLGELLVMVAG
jgi:hypothetical protein